MSTIGGTTTGLASGIDYGAMIEGLLELEQQPVDILRDKINKNELKQEAYGSLLTQALGVKLSMADFAGLSTFEQKKSTSSNESLLTATVDRNAANGNHSIQVARLASSSINVSEGLSDSDSATVGSGTLTFELGGVRLDKPLELDFLNDGAGVMRDEIVLTDTTGKSEVIDLSAAISFDQVLDQFNSNGMGLVMSTDRDVTDSSTGYKLKITNSSSDPNYQVTMSDSSSSTTLDDLGFSSTGTNTITTTGLTGAQIHYLSDSTKLNLINDGFGITTNASGTKDLRFYVENSTGDMTAVEVDLSGSQDIGDVINAINTAMFDAGVNDVSSVDIGANGVSLEFTGTVSEFTSLDGSTAARDLGLDKIASGVGEALLAEMGSSLIRNLHGGHGIDGLESGTFKIKSRAGDQYNVNLRGAVSVSDVVSIINGTGDSKPTNDYSGETVTDVVSNSADDALYMVIDKLNDGTISAEEMIGKTIVFDTLTATASLSNKTREVVDVITEFDLDGTGPGTVKKTVVVFDKSFVTAAAAGDTYDIRSSKFDIRASINESGNGIKIEDTSIGSGTFRIDDVSGRVAEQLGVETTLSIEPVLFNPQVSADGGKSVVYLAQDSLPDGITDNDMVGRSLEIRWTSLNSMVGGSLANTDSVESARIAAFKKAPDAVRISAIEATASTPSISTAGGKDTITDFNNINSSLNSDIFIDNLIGSTFSIYKSDGTKVSSTVESFNDASGSLTFSDDAFSAAAIAATDIESQGYTIEYNHEIILAYDGGDPISKANNGSDSFLSTHSGNVDQVRIVGVGSSESVVGRNLENRMMSGATRLDDLNGGKGIDKGTFTISSGTTSADIDLELKNIQTVQELLDEISAQITSVTAELNDRGDGLRIYDTSGGSLSIADKTGTAAADLNIITSTMDKAALSMTTGENLYSLKGIASTVALTANYDIRVTEFVGAEREQIVGSRLSFVDINGRNHAIVQDYIEVDTDGDGIADAADLALGLAVNESNIDGTTTSVASGDEVEIILKKHFSEFESVGTVASKNDLDADGIDNPGTHDQFRIKIDGDPFSDSYESLIGSYVSFSSSNIARQVTHETYGGQAMIVAYDSGTNEITLQGFNTDFFDVKAIHSRAQWAGKKVYVHISKVDSPNKAVQSSTLDTANSFVYDLDDNNYISLTAEVNSESASNGSVILSDQFANLNPDDVVGSLLTIKTNAADSTDQGNVALVTGYDSATKAITVGGYYKNGVADAVTIAAGDEIYLTYASELEGAVLKSDAPSSVTGKAVSDAITNSSNNELYMVFNDLNDGPPSTLSADEVIGSKVTFETGALNGVSRKIVDVIHDFDVDGSGAGVVRKAVVVFDEALPTAVATTDTYTLSSGNIKATIDEVDFKTGVIETREKLSGGLGRRNYSIHSAIDGSYQQEVRVLETDTLDDIATRINGLNLGVSANIISDGSGSNPYRLSVTADETGSAGAVNVSSTVSGFDFKTTSKGEDAKVMLGSGSGSSSLITSGTNTVTEAITGVTLNLMQASTEVINLTVSNDTEGIVEKMTTIVEEVNTLLDSASGLIALENEVEVTDEDGNVTKEKQKGLLFGDSTTRSLINEIKALLTDPVEGVTTGAIQYWEDIGITLDTTGQKFEFDDSVLTSQLSSNLDQVKDLFIITPNLASNASLAVSSNFVQTNYNIQDIRNGDTSSSGFSETGNGSNGIKVAAGDESKSMTYTFGEEQNLYGFRFHHHVPDDLTARFTVGNNTSSSIATPSKLIDATNLGSSAEILSEQIVGATLTVGTAQAKITAYDESTGTLDLDTDLSGSGENPHNGYVITTPSGESISFRHTILVEYRDPTTGSYETFKEYKNIGDGSRSIVFPGSLFTDSLRISYKDNSGDSEDFTKNGYFARLMEFEVLDSQGLGSKFSRAFNSFTDSFSGSIPLATEAIGDVNDGYETQMLRLLESIDASANRYIQQFSTLEQTIATLNSQQSYLQSTLGSMPKAFSHRGNNN